VAFYAPQYGGFSPAYSSGFASPQFASSGFGFPVQHQQQQWGIPPELQPLGQRQATSSQALFANQGQYNHLFNAGAPQQQFQQYSNLFNAGPQQFAPQQFVPQQFAPQQQQQIFSAGPVAGRVYAAPIAAARPTDIYASAASVYSQASQAHSVAASVHSVYSQGSAAGSVYSVGGGGGGSVISAPSQFAAATRQARRRGTQYGRWKDSQSVVARIPQMNQRMPDPLVPPKRTSYKRFKDAQVQLARMGL